MWSPIVDNREEFAGMVAQGFGLTAGSRSVDPHFLVAPRSRSSRTCSNAARSRLLLRGDQRRRRGDHGPIVAKLRRHLTGAGELDLRSR